MRRRDGAGRRRTTRKSRQFLFFNESGGTKVAKWKRKKKKTFGRNSKGWKSIFPPTFFPPSSAGRGIQIRSRAERSSSAKTQRGTRSSVCRKPCFKDDSRLQKKGGGGCQRLTTALRYIVRTAAIASGIQFTPRRAESQETARPTDLNEAAGPVGAPDLLTLRPQFCPESAGNKT